MHASTATWAVCVVATLALVVLLHVTDTAVQRGSLTIMAGVVLVMVCLHRVYTRLRPDPLIAAATGGTAALLWAGLTAGMIALAGLRTGAALIDHYLAYADALLGADTRRLVAWTARHPWVGQILMVAYASAVPAVFAAALLLAHAHRSERMWNLCLEFAVLAVLCALSSALLPANGAFVHHGTAPAILSALPGNSGIFHMHVVEAYRSGSRAVVDVLELEGVATFPSFHTAMAAMTAYAVRGMRWITPAASIWCALVIASTIPIGGHYIVDLIAGSAAWAAVACLGQLLGRSHPNCAASVAEQALPPRQRRSRRPPAAKARASTVSEYHSRNR